MSMSQGQGIALGDGVWTIRGDNSQLPGDLNQSTQQVNSAMQQIDNTTTGSINGMMSKLGEFSIAMGAAYVTLGSKITDALMGSTNQWAKTGGEITGRRLLDNVYHLTRCELCRQPAAVEPAHSNWAVHGKGKGIKADDNRIAAACRSCHAELDQGTRFTEEEKQGWWWPAHVRTVAALIGAGLWVPGVPIPDTVHSPFSPVESGL